MINTINLTTGSTADVGAALSTIGFTVDSSDNTKYYYDNDTNHKMYLKVAVSGSNTQLRFMTSGGSTLGSTMQFASASAAKLCYEVIGNSIIFGVVTSTVANKLHFGIIEPKTQDDDWIYFAPYSNQFANGRTEAIWQILNQCCQFSATGFYIVKGHDGARFLDNLYVTAVSPALAIYSDNNAINYATAEIENDYYRIINISSNANTMCKVAIKLPTT